MSTVRGGNCGALYEKEEVGRGRKGGGEWETEPLPFDSKEDRRRGRDPLFSAPLMEFLLSIRCYSQQ